MRKTQRLLKTPGRACEWAIFCTGDNRPFGCLVAVVAWDQWNLDSNFNKFQVFTWYLLFSGFNMFQFQLVHCISHISQDCQALSPFPRPFFDFYGNLMLDSNMVIFNVIYVI